MTVLQSFSLVILYFIAYGTIMLWPIKPILQKVDNDEQY